MSRYFTLDNNMFKVEDIEGLKSWIEENKAGKCNGEDLSHLIHLNYTANPEENKLD